MTGHTTAPWTARQCGIFAKDKLIACTGDKGDEEEMKEQIANAKLMAEAPNLLKALDDIAKGMIPALPPLDDKHEFRYRMWQWSQDRARAAIDEAKNR